MRYDFDSGEMTVAREPEPGFESGEMREFLDWYCSYQDSVIISTLAEGVSRRLKFVKFRGVKISW